MKYSKIAACVLLAYSLCVAVAAESINSIEEGGMLQNWHWQQEGGVGSGIGEMSGHYHDFQNFLTILGIWVYPASVYSAVIFIKQAYGSKSRVKKNVFLGCTVLCFLVLARFFWLGVFSAVKARG